MSAKVYTLRVSHCGCNILCAVLICYLYLTELIHAWFVQTKCGYTYYLLRLLAITIESLKIRFAACSVKAAPSSFGHSTVSAPYVSDHCHSVLVLSRYGIATSVISALWAVTLT